MRFNTLSEELEHIKQCKNYADMLDEVETKSCWECDTVVFKCDSTKWQFKSDYAPHWYCNECFKSIKD